MLLAIITAVATSVGTGFSIRTPQARIDARGALPLTALALGAAYWALAALVAFSLGERWRYDDGLRLTAFRNADWSGPPAYEDLDTLLSNDLIGRAPFTLWPVFSIEWNGYLAIERPGDYTFALTSDDGSLLEIDGTPVVENGGIHRERRVTGVRHLEAGLHAVRARYFQAGDHSTLSVLWSSDGDAFHPMPPSRLLPERMSFLEYRLRPLRSVGATVLALAACVGLFAGLWPWMRRAAGSPLGDALGRGLAVLERPGPAIALLLVVGGVVRLAVLATSPAVLWPDSHVFYESARRVLGGQWTDHDGYRTLIYPWFLAAFLRWSRSPATGVAITAAQHLMGLAAAVLFYDVGRRVLSPLVALAASLLFVVHATELYYEAAVLTETLFTLTLAVTLWITLATLRRPSVARAAGLGLAAATLVLVRPVAQWFVGIPLGLVLMTSALRAKRLPTATALLACYAVPVVLWMGVNEREYGFYGVALGRGMGLYTRVFDIDELSPPVDTAQPGMRDLWAMARQMRWSPNRVRDELNYVRRESAATADDAMFRFALETLRAHPATFAARSVRQWVVQLAEPNVGVRSCPSGFGRYLCSGRTDEEALPAFPNVPDAPSRLRPAVVGYVEGWPVPMKPVVALALIGAIWAWRQRLGPGPLLLGLTVVYLTAVPALTLAPQDRFRLPADPALFLFACAGLTVVAETAAARVEAWFGAPPAGP